MFAGEEVINSKKSLGALADQCFGAQSPLGKMLSFTSRSCRELVMKRASLSYCLKKAVPVREAELRVQTVGSVMIWVSRLGVFRTAFGVL